jgi:hypothetical protein
MAVNWRINGALAANATVATLTVTAPSTGVIPGDIYIAFFLLKSTGATPVVAPTPPGDWVEIVNTVAASNPDMAIFWRRVASGDEGASYTFTKSVDDNTLFCGFIAAFSGCLTSGNPIDASTPTTSSNASSDTVTYADFDPTETSAFVVAVGGYNEDNTTAGAISGTNPSFTNRADLETATGTDGSIFMYTGSSDGAATGARSHSTSSTVDAENMGVMFGLVAEPAATATWPGWVSSKGGWF